MITNKRQLQHFILTNVKLKKRLYMKVQQLTLQFKVLCFHYKSLYILYVVSKSMLSVKSVLKNITAAYRSQPDKSAGSAGDWTGRAGRAGGSDGLLHSFWSSRLCTGSHKPCDGTPRLSHRSRTQNTITYLSEESTLI